jgi:hypothetical protein
MVVVREMQVAIDEIADMVAVRHSLVPASRSMDMASVVTGTSVIRRATDRVRRVDLDHMLVNMTIVHVMQVAIVKVVDVVAMAHARVAASWAMDV